MKIEQLHPLGRRSWRCKLTFKNSRQYVLGRAKTALGAYINAVADAKRLGLK